MKTSGVTPKIVFHFFNRSMQLTTEETLSEWHSPAMQMHAAAEQIPTIAQHQTHSDFGFSPSTTPKGTSTSTKEILQRRFVIASTVKKLAKKEHTTFKVIEKIKRSR